MPLDDSPARHGTVPAPPRAAAFEDVYERFAGLLRFLARRRFRVPDADVEALVQDAFVAYLSDPGSVRDVRSYLVGTICNRCRKYWSHRDRERSVFGGEALATLQVNDRAIDDILDRLALDATLAQLNAGCREVLTRHYREHEPVDSIAADLDTKAAYIHKRLHLCRKRAFEVFRRLAGTRITDA